MEGGGGGGGGGRGGGGGGGGGAKRWKVDNGQGGQRWAMSRGDEILETGRKLMIPRRLRGGVFTFQRTFAWAGNRRWASFRAFASFDPVAPDLIARSLFGYCLVSSIREVKWEFGPELGVRERGVVGGSGELSSESMTLRPGGRHGDSQTRAADPVWRVAPRRGLLRNWGAELWISDWSAGDRGGRGRRIGRGGSAAEGDFDSENQSLPGVP